jgi:hypothetical protein
MILLTENRCCVAFDDIIFLIRAFFIFGYPLPSQRLLPHRLACLFEKLN